MRLIKRLIPRSLSGWLLAVAIATHIAMWILWPSPAATFFAFTSATLAITSGSLVRFPTTESDKHTDHTQ